MHIGASHRQALPIVPQKIYVKNILDELLSL